MSLTSPMDGIPYIIWRDFPHPHGPNEHGRGLIPFTEFEITLARQILSYTLYRQQHSQAFVDPALLLPSSAAGALGQQQERVVRELPRRARTVAPHEEIAIGYVEEDMGWAAAVTLGLDDALRPATSAIFVEAPEEDDASTDGSESEMYDHDVENPSLFSHRSTVQDLIDSFHRDTIGPLGGTDVHEENDCIILSNAPILDTLDCALGKWEIEQEEHELEMRWRATKRVSENWLTRVGPVREQKEREWEQRKGGTGAMGKLVAKDGAVLQQQGNISWPQSHPLVQQSRTQTGVGRGVPVAGSRPPPAPQAQLRQFPPTHSPAPPTTILNASGHANAAPLPSARAPSIATASSQTTSVSSPTETASPPTETTSPSTTSPRVTAAALPALVPPAFPAPLITHTAEHTMDPPIATGPATPAPAVATSQSSTPTPASASMTQAASAVSPIQSVAPSHAPLPSRLHPHTPYDPRAPYFKELPLEDLIYIPTEPGQLQQLNFPGSPQGYDFMRSDGTGQYYQQYAGPSRLTLSRPVPHSSAQHVRYGHDPVGRVMCSCEQPSAPAVPTAQPQSGILSARTSIPSPTYHAIIPSSHLPSSTNEIAPLALSTHDPVTSMPIPQVSNDDILHTARPYQVHLGREPAQGGLSAQLPHNGSFTQVSETQPPFHPRPLAAPQLEGRPTAVRHGSQPYPLPQAALGTPPSNGTSVSAPPDGYRNGTAYHRAHPQPPTASFSRAYPLPAPYPPVVMTQQERLVAQDKVMRHVTLLAQAPRITVGQIIVRNPIMTRASNLAPLFLALFPEYAGKDASVFGGDVRSFEPTTKSSVPPNAAPSMPEPPQDTTSPPTVPDEAKSLSSSRAMSGVAAQALPVSPALRKVTLPDSTSASGPVSPQTVTASICTDPGVSTRSDSIPRSLLECAPTGRRLIRVAKDPTGDIFGPTYWFEPDVESAERIRNAVSLMEWTGGWKRPERKTRTVDGQRKAKGPDDLLP